MKFLYKLVNQEEGGLTRFWKTMKIIYLLLWPKHQKSVLKLCTKKFPNNFDDICVENRPWEPLQFGLQTHSPNCAFYKFYKETCKNSVLCKLIAQAFIQTTNTILAKSAPDMYRMYICTWNGFEKQARKSQNTVFNFVQINRSRDSCQK